MKSYIGIDLGTSATKAALVAGGRVLARSRAVHADARSVRGRANTQAWAASLSEAIAGLGPEAAHAEGIGLAVHCPTVLLLDEDGNVLTSGVTWDHPDLPRYVERGAKVRTARERALTGNRVSPATFVAVAWHLLREVEPEAALRARYIGLVGTWLGMLLTGRAALDPTQASYTGVFAVTDGSWAWQEDLIERLDIPRSKLPDIAPTLSVLGALSETAASLLGLRAGIPVIVGSADTPAASYALDSSPSGNPFFIMGTTHVISNCVENADPSSRALQRADVHPGQYLLNGVINGGDALAIGAQMLGYGNDSGSVDCLIADAARAQVSDLNEAPIFIPHVVPERGPLWFSQPRTALLGKVASTSRVAAARGVVEGVLFADRLVIESCVDASKGAVMLSGAFENDPAMPQMLADILGRDILVVDEGHLPSIGAARMCAEVLDGTKVTPPAMKAVRPRKDWADYVEQRWTAYRQTWERITEEPCPEEHRRSSDPAMVN